MFNFARYSTATLLLCACAPLTAQERTIPSSLFWSEGNASFALVGVPARLQCAYGAKATTWTRNTTISSLALRIDNQSSIEQDLRFEVRVLVSSEGVDASLGSSDWSKNHGKDLATFVAKRQMVIPAVRPRSSLAPFDIALKGDRPFVASESEFLVDTTFFSSNFELTSLVFDAEDSSKSGLVGTAHPYGSACGIAGEAITTPEALVGKDLFLDFGATTTVEGGLCWLGTRRVDWSIGFGCLLYARPEIIVDVFRAGRLAKGYFGTIPQGVRGQRVYAQGGVIARDGTWGLTRGLAIEVGELADTAPRYACASRWAYSVVGRVIDPDRDAPFGWNKSLALVHRIR